MMHRSAAATETQWPDPVRPPTRRPVLRPTDRRGQRVLCAAVFVILVAWALVFRHSGDADATFHYLDARDAWVDPAELLSAWDRPLFKLYLLLPAQGGVLAARVAMAALFGVLMWQTIELARELGVARPVLAGAFLILQPMVFSLASDTMSELPMALGIVVAIRLWQRGWTDRPGFLALSCLVVSLLPMVRPEGFWLCAMWGVMVLVATHVGPLRRRLLLALPLAAGSVLWMLACWIFIDNPFYVLDFWSWPARSYDVYGRGSLLHHVIRWPLYAGAVLTVLFIAGVRPSWRREMSLPWAIWLLIFVLHSVLFWRGWFASLGLMRILATTAPLTALICLFGWNHLAEVLPRRGWSALQRRRAALVTLALATGIVLVHFVLRPQHLRTLPMRRAVAQLQARDLIAGAPLIVISDKVVLAELNLPPRPSGVLDPGYDADALRGALRGAPVGTVGIWDNQRALDWYRLGIGELRALGYEVLAEETQLATRQQRRLLPLWAWYEWQRYYVVRKVTP